jgi:hypothetical protein
MASKKNTIKINHLAISKQGLIGLKPKPIAPKIKPSADKIMIAVSHQYL